MKRLVLILMGALALACASVPRERAVQNLYSGGLETVKKPQGVAAFRIEGSGPGKKDGKRFLGFDVLEGPAPVDSGTAGELAKVLENPDSYAWDLDKSERFTPAVGIRFEGVDDLVDVLLDFDTNRLEARRTFVETGRVQRRGRDIDPCRADVLALVHRIFPGWDGGQKK